ncbi:hypothetical protein SAMN06297164_3480 [Nitrosomonas ureae]|uniref:Uncharacterized protein n=1 Tax=Nitrosomonas ureae TaxID=44577 RepID=A0A286AKM1_9PROT|nr:hypothetical protein SAMN06297164_3480 [Nitrosomonas ureae]
MILVPVTFTFDAVAATAYGLLEFAFFNGIPIGSMLASQGDNKNFTGIQSGRRIPGCLPPSNKPEGIFSLIFRSPYKALE